MHFMRKAGFLSALLLGITAGAWGQFMGRGMGQQPPHMPGIFKPVVGSGAEYEATLQDETMDFSWAVLGQEKVDDQEGYWLEIRTQGGKMQGEMVMKQLIVMSGDQMGMKRMIMQAPGRPPMEMPAGMMRMAPHHGPPAEEAGGEQMGEMIGTESVTVPAGTFECEHYRKQEGRKTIDYWISSKVSPYGVVKMTSPEMTMVLKKELKNETSHIKGEPEKMEMPHF
jgi:hypothetical protein